MDKEDMISVLPDDVLLGIIQLLDLRAAVRAGALARRWRRLPRLLPDIAIDVADLIPHAKDIMAAYADAARWLLAPTEHRTIRVLRLACYLPDDHDLLHSIGHAVAESAAERWEFTARTEVDHRAISQSQWQRDVLGPRFMPFVGACPVAFRQLTSLTLHNLRLRNSDIDQLLNTCERLELLSLHRCLSVGDFPWLSDLQIDTPSSSLVTLELHGCYYPAVQLTRVPKLERLLCYADRMDWHNCPMVEFGHVPCLRDINLSTDHLRFYSYISLATRIPVFLWCLTRRMYTPKFEHHSLVLLEIAGYELEEDAHVVRYIKLIEERAVCLKRVRLLQQTCSVAFPAGIPELLL